MFFIESYAYQTKPVYLAGYTPYRFVIVKYPGDPHYTYGVIRACNNRVGSSRDASSDFAPSCPILFGSRGDQYDMFRFGYCGDADLLAGFKPSGTWSVFRNTSVFDGIKLTLNSNGTGSLIEECRGERIYIPQEPVYSQYRRFYGHVATVMTGGYPITQVLKYTASFSWKLKDGRLILNYNSLTSKKETVIDFSDPMWSGLSNYDGYDKILKEQSKKDFPTNHYVKEFLATDWTKSETLSGSDTLLLLPAAHSAIFELPDLFDGGTVVAPFSRAGAAPVEASAFAGDEVRYCFLRGAQNISASLK